MEHKELFNTIPLFDNIPEDQLRVLIALCEVKHFPKNQMVFTVGEQSYSLYIILKGQLRAYLDDENGKRIMLSTMGTGDFFGELSLLSDHPRSANVRTVTQCELATISKPNFDKFLIDNPTVTSPIIGSLINRIYHLTDKLSNLVFQDVYGRVVQVLNDHAEEDNGVTMIGPIKQQEIANVIGSSREMVSRILKDLRIGGYISIVKKTIIINRHLPSKW